MFEHCERQADARALGQTLEHRYTIAQSPKPSTQVSELIVIYGPGTLSSMYVHVLRVSHMFKSMFSLSLHSKTSSEGPSSMTYLNDILPLAKTEDS